MALIDFVEIPRRTIVLFFIVGTSGSMEGSKIGAVNTAIKELICEIRGFNENPDVLMKIAVLEFSTGARWITPEGPVEVDKFEWKNLEASGVSDFGAAFKALNKKLTVKGFMEERSASFAPILFLLSDSESTDHWKKELDELKKNGWYKAAIKLALAIGEDADKNILKEFTETPENVIDSFSSEELIKIIRFNDMEPFAEICDVEAFAGKCDDSDDDNDQKPIFVSTIPTEEEIKEINERLAFIDDSGW